MDFETIVRQSMLNKGYKNKGIAPDTYNQMVQDGVQDLITKIQSYILAELPESREKELSDLMDAGDEQRIQEFIVKNIPNYAKVTEEAVTDFEKDYF